MRYFFLRVYDVRVFVCPFNYTAVAVSEKVELSDTDLTTPVG